ncbi:MAG: ABC transporter permease [Alphaproteobacteria bacterium]|nr:ABC transporter permease [Alphaproteobacteria bacterium]
MLSYIARRLLLMPVSLLLVLGIVFLIVRITGDPVEIYLGPEATQEQIDLLRSELQLDRPLWEQFAIFLADVLRGDFGTSIQHKAAALPLVVERLGATVELAAIAFALAIVAGVGLGILAAVRVDRPADFVISSIAVAGQSMPSFWLGILLIQLFALDLGWLPTSGRGTAAQLVLPAVTLATFILPNFVLVTRTAILEIARDPFVMAARARGASEGRILFAHVLPNALNPVISLAGLQVGRLMGGAVVTESIFAWPGVGRLIIASVFQRDLPVVVAAVFIVSLTIVVTNLLVDLAQATVDARIRLG